MAESVEGPEDLYSVDPGDFVAERKALAARLRVDGDRDAATAVMAMRKPPRSAWALNVLARAEPDVIEQVLGAARAVAAAIAEGGDELRSAQRDYTSAVTATVDAAAQRSALSGDPLLEKMRATVLAAGAEPDGEVAENLRAGTLATDAAAPGFSFTGMDLSANDSPAPAARARRPAADRSSRRTRAADAAPSSDDPTVAAEPASPAKVSADDEATATDASRAAAAAAAEKDAAEKEAAAAARAERAAAALAQRRRARERTRLMREIDRRAQRVARLVEVADAAEAAALEARTTATEAASELEAARAKLAELERSDD